MRELIDALITLCKYVFMAMVWLAMFGVLVIIGMGMEGGEIVRSKWFFYTSAYTISVLSILCIYLYVNSR